MRVVLDKPGVPPPAKTELTEVIQTEEKLYVLYDGRLSSIGLVMERSDYQLTAGMKFGDLSLEGSSKGKMRSATIVADADTYFAVLKRSDYDVSSRFI